MNTEDQKRYRVTVILATSAIALLVAYVSLLVLAGCASLQSQHGLRDVPELSAGVYQGYLQKDQFPDSAKLLPAPPAPGSPGFAQDAAVHDQSMALSGTPRWKLASSDADLSFPHIVGAFECALGVSLNKEATPRLYQLVQRTMVDAGMATSAGKHKCNRMRPFVTYNETTCFPHDEPLLRGDGSYPSGHTALGWATALVLVETAPDRRDALLARGRSYGESRLICNAHWQSDVLEGRYVGAATVASLHTVPEFLQDIAIAKKEVTAARAAGTQPTRDCAAEADALAQPIPGVL